MQINFGPKAEGLCLTMDSVALCPVGVDITLQLQ